MTMIKVNGTPADPSVYLDEDGNEVSLPESVADLRRALHGAYAHKGECQPRPSSPPKINPAKPWYTVAEVAAMLCVSRDTVVRRFVHENGVMVGGNTETVRGRRRYRQFRIPPHVVTRVVNRTTVK